MAHPRLLCDPLPINHRIDAPRLTLDRVAGKRVLVTASDGIGDEVLYAAAYGHLVDVCADVSVECDPRLVLTLRRSLGVRAHPWDRTVLPTGVIQRYRWAPPVDGWIEGRDVLAHAMRTLPDRYALGERNRRGWLTPDPARLSEMRAHVDPLRPAVGIVWADIAARADRATLYPSLDDWRQVLDVGADLISLQYGYGDVLDPPPGVRRIAGLDTMDDIDGVLALISLLDVVIAPACSVVWMAASVGTEVWSPRPWPTRMCTEGIEHLPGFPAVRPVWRNAPGEDTDRPWAPCMEAIAAALMGLS